MKSMRHLPSANHHLPTVHTPVLLHEVVEGLALRKGMTVVDCTVNAAGHTVAIAEELGLTGTIVGIDADPQAISRARERVGPLPCKVHLSNGNFRDLASILDSLGIKTVNAVLFDLGLSSDQLESSGRGFSFQGDEPLSMNFSGGFDDSKREGGLSDVHSSADSPQTLTARDIVNEWSEESLADVIWGYGGERYARRIAKAIVEARALSIIERTSTLVTIVESAVPASYRRARLHPATKTFQALRVAVNDELGALRTALPQAWEMLEPGGRLAVVSFHELEDRIVKFFFKDKKLTGEGAPLTKKPIVPGSREVAENPRARSAKLRIIIKSVMP